MAREGLVRGGGNEKQGQPGGERRGEFERVKRRVVTVDGIERLVGLYAGEGFERGDAERLRAGGIGGEDREAGQGRLVAEAAVGRDRSADCGFAGVGAVLQQGGQGRIGASDAGVFANGASGFRDHGGLGVEEQLFQQGRVALGEATLCASPAGGDLPEMVLDDVAERHGGGEADDRRFRSGNRAELIRVTGPGAAERILAGVAEHRIAAGIILDHPDHGGQKDVCAKPTDRHRGMVADAGGRIGEQGSEVGHRWTAFARPFRGLGAEFGVRVLGQFRKERPAERLDLREKPEGMDLCDERVGFENPGEVSRRG